MNLKNIILIILLFFVSNNIYSQRLTPVEPLGSIRMDISGGNSINRTSCFINLDNRSKYSTDSFDILRFFRNGYDSLNITTAAYDTIYDRIERRNIVVNNNFLSLNSIPVPDDDIFIPIRINSNFRSSRNNILTTITFSEFEYHLPNNLNLYLKDNETNTLYPLYAGFTFQLNLEPNSIIDRYSLLFIPEITNISPIQNDLDVRLEQNILKISSTKKIDKLLLYNLTGVNLYKEDNINNNHQINTINFTNGYYFIYIISESKLQKHLILLSK